MWSKSLQKMQMIFIQIDDYIEKFAPYKYEGDPNETDNDMDTLSFMSDYENNFDQDDIENEKEVKIQKPNKSDFLSIILEFNSLINLITEGVYLSKNSDIDIFKYKKYFNVYNVSSGKKNTKKNGEKNSNKGGTNKTKSTNQINTIEITDKVNSNSETEDQEKKPDGMKEIKIIYDMIAKKIHNMNRLDQDEPYNAYILQNIFAYGNKNKLRKLNKNQLIIINSFHKIFLHTMGVYQI